MLFKALFIFLGIIKMKMTNHLRPNKERKKRTCHKKDYKSHKNEFQQHRSKALKAQYEIRENNMTT